jgi:hypothetical protein
MLPDSHPSVVVSVGVAAFIVWRVYARISRMVGRQRLRPARPWVTVFLFPTLLALLLFGSIARPASALALVAGAALGAALGAYGLRLTKFEQTPSGLFYTPNAHLGIALSLLLLARIGYRVAQFYFAAAAPAPAAVFLRSPLTLLLFGTLAGYYTAYAIGLLRWSSSLRTSKDNP